jgi:hypothetical protein
MQAKQLVLMEGIDVARTDNDSWDLASSPASATACRAMNRPPSGTPAPRFLCGEYAGNRRADGVANFIKKRFELAVVGGLGQFAVAQLRAGPPRP